ncbi:EGF-like domain protein [Onchocerca flexuosa]|uniref:EGF-like domain protein n=1 Tax=Onchocerca flexuosa TaxID=387005 RepID=A0A238BZQ2_9BILA|nr:EGF-like domain protein [Onchocerca flexuosa]
MAVHSLHYEHPKPSISLMNNNTSAIEIHFKFEIVEVIIQCNDRGEFRNGQCHCAGHFFGSQCQYVSRCDYGKRKNGRCLCDKGWKGDYCHDIICQHGYPDVNNKSKSCVCPARFTGAHCDRCSQKGPKIRPYPECNIDVSKSKAKLQRQEAETQVNTILYY